GSLAAGAYCTVPSVISAPYPFTRSRRNPRPADGILLPVISP
ncbi:transcriptional regulator, partial [Escherichia coli]|nr:transcriptional regulator [Escherichia coli]